MTLVDVQNYVPPRLSEDITGVLFGVGIEPMEIFVSVSVAASLMVLMSSSFYPCIKVVSWLMFVPAVGITVIVIVPMLGAVVNDLVPFVPVGVFLHDLFCPR